METTTFTNNTNKHLVVEDGTKVIAIFDTASQAEQYVNDNFVCGIMDFVAPGETVTHNIHAAGKTPSFEMPGFDSIFGK